MRFVLCLVHCTLANIFHLLCSFAMGAVDYRRASEFSNPLSIRSHEPSKRGSSERDCLSVFLMTLMVRFDLVSPSSQESRVIFPDIGMTCRQVLSTSFSGSQHHLRLHPFHILPHSSTLKSSRRDSCQRSIRQLVNPPQLSTSSDLTSDAKLLQADHNDRVKNEDP